MDGGAWWATVHGVAESRTRLSDFTHSLAQLRNRMLLNVSMHVSDSLQPHVCVLSLQPQTWHCSSTPSQCRGKEHGRWD